MNRDEFMSEFSAMIADLQSSNPERAADKTSLILTENEVRDAVEDYLRVKGWEFISRARDKEKGIDLVMLRDGIRLEIEAKGAGPGPGSENYGQAFTSAQVIVHVGSAVLKAMQSLSAGGTFAAIALPETSNHLRQVGRALVALESLGIVVFWVAEDRTVRPEGNLAAGA